MSQRDTSLRVLHIVSGDLWAGAEAQVAALLTHLACNPDVALCAVVLNPGELARRLSAAGIPMVLLDERRLSALAILRQLRRVIRTFEPHVVHTHRSKENVLGGLAARLEGRRPSLRSVHGAPEHRPALWRADKHAVRWLDDLSARRWQQMMVAVSEDLGRRLRSAHHGRRVEVIHNGLDPAMFGSLRARHCARPAGSGRRAVLLGRLVPVKRADLFLRAAGELVARGGNDWRFDVVGEGPLRAGLESLAQDLGLSPAVLFHGFRQDGAEILAAGDVLVFTSDHEGTPIAALEALAIGVPIVARAVGGLVELLDGVAGCRLVDSDQPPAFADAIEAVAGKGGVPAPELPDRYGIATCGEQYVALYRRLVAGG